MDIGQRLRLMRALHCLSQDEMASLGETIRTTYASVETGRRPIASHTLQCISEKLGWSPDWIIGRSDCIFADTGLLYIEIAASRLIASSQNIIDRRRNDAVRNADELLPIFLGLLQPEEMKVFSFVNDFYGALYVVKAKQILIFKAEQFPRMIETVKAVIKKFGGDLIYDDIKIEDPFLKMKPDDPDSIRNFIQAVSGNAYATDTMHFPRKIPTNPTATFDQSVRESIIHRICNDMALYSINFNDISEYQARRESDKRTSH